MSDHNFENLEVWKKGCDLAVKVYVASHDSKQYALKDQIQRSSLSIPSNIAEGAERNSPKEFARFLSYSHGSCGELRTQLLIHGKVCQELGLEPFRDLDEMISETQTLSRMLRSLMRRIQSQSPS